MTNTSNINATLARVLIHFQDTYLTAWPSQGLLCQTWMPCDPHEVDPDQLPDASSASHVVLRTKGFPFFVAGQSDADHLAFFRCISCRYTFGTDVQVPKELGAPGRVFLTGKPEALGDIGAMKREEFHRTDHAKTCSLKSCLLLPVYYPDAPRRCVGVVEVLTNNPELAYTQMGAMISDQLAKYGLSTCPLSALENEGAGEVSPTLQQLEVTSTVFQSGERGQNAGNREAGLAAGLSRGQANGTSYQGCRVEPWADSGRAERANQQQDQEGDRRMKARQEEHGSGFVTVRDSVRLGLTLADLKSLMKQKRIKTLSRNSMGRYEEEVDLLLNLPAGLKRKVPSEIGIDSRWDAAGRLPQKRSADEQRRRTQEKQEALKARRPATPADFMYGGFPVVRQPNGKLVANYQMISGRQKSRNRGSNTNERRKHDGNGGNGLVDVVSKDGMDVSMPIGFVTAAPNTSHDVRVNEGLAHQVDNAGNAGSGGSGGLGATLSAGDSEDWLGMIDPQMLDLMVNDNVLDAVGNIDDIQLF